MLDPLAVRQILLKECLNDLQSLFEDMPNVNARVSTARRQRLRTLNARLVRAQAGSSRARAREVTDAVSEAVAQELALWMVETSFFVDAVRSGQPMVYEAFVSRFPRAEGDWSQRSFLGLGFILARAA
jgi:hypothetical protein